MHHGSGYHTAQVPSLSASSPRAYQILSDVHQSRLPRWIKMPTMNAPYIMGCRLTGSDAMHLNRERVVQHLTPPPGIIMPPYPQDRDRRYRWSLAGLAFGLSVQTVAVWTHNATGLFIGQGVAALSTLLASWSFLVWVASWRYLVRLLAVSGLLLWPWWHLGGWATILAAASVMAAKETHCFHFPAGRIIPWFSVFLGMLLLSPLPDSVVAGGWTILAGLWWWLAIDRSRLPLFEL